MQTQFSSLDCSDADSAPPQPTSLLAQEFVGKSAESLSVMSDADLQAYICECAEHFCAAQKRYEASGNFADAGDRDRFWSAESEALRVRGSRAGRVARA